MPDFEDLGDFLSPTLDLPVGDVTYKVPSPPALVGLRLQAAFVVANARQAGIPPSARWVRILNDDDDDRSLEQKALGPVYDQMVTDGVDIRTLNHAGMTAYLWVVAGDDAAHFYWVSPLGKASRPNRSI